MGNSHDYGVLTDMVGAALGKPGLDRRSLAHYEWDISGRCHAPVAFELTARNHGEFAYVANPDKLVRQSRRVVQVLGGKLISKRYGEMLLPMGAVKKVRTGSVTGFFWLSLYVRCRKCPACLRARAKMWRERAIIETNRASRTWFLTLTLSPDSHFRILSEARFTGDQTRNPFEAMNEQEQFAARCRALGPHITRYVKRVRKSSEAPLRYLFVTEKHKTGLPHLHALVHEQDAFRPVRKAVLKEQWQLGFSDVKLCRDTATAGYLCKYLSKTLATRVRGSLKYGGLIDPFTVSDQIQNEFKIDHPPQSKGTEKWATL